MDLVLHFYGTRRHLLNFKAKSERFAPDVVLDIIPYTEAQAQAVVQVFSGCTQRIVAVSSGAERKAANLCISLLERIGDGQLHPLP
ncbi:hypothetical protein IQ273_06505 [Nodosilinea sp. LEGE 07298]|uniref:hypothetical protein n=1 Tax=Nodosilinea sp. LEGE 07298 TaxID=2777970 RepID=UPI001880AF0E|nr:hypothetical protein [Nodosilinea sp. LEGE 07298]MBE9109069.1 hypothetical protein [Nodosilinea sp. LEGE 07298]